MAAMVIGVASIGALQALGVLNRNAAGVRSLTNARAIVQRNIDMALSVTGTTSSIPAILAVTSATGTVYDDDAGTANVVAVMIQSTSGVNLVEGTLTRIVRYVDTTSPSVESSTAVAGQALIVRITFSLTYTYRGRNYSYSQTTMRAIDD